MLLRAWLRLCLVVLIAACSACSNTDGIEGTGINGGDAGPGVEDLCVSNACAEIIPLIDIPDAENILFSPDGRLFVTGGQNVYEIKHAEDGTYSATPLVDHNCSFTGMAIRAGYLYAVGCGNQLLAGRLTEQPALTEIFAFEGMCIANGTALGPDGHLYVVDEPLVSVEQPQNCVLPDPKIVRLTIDPNDPMQVLSQETWLQGSPLGQLFLGLDNVLRLPNGLAVDDHTFYGTDGGSVYSVTLQPDGSPGEVMPLYFEPTAHDDLGLVRDGILVTDFFLGRILLLSREGTLLQQMDALTFVSPSSARLAKPPMFEPTDILVTEKGVLGDNSLPIDRLTLLRRRAE